MAPKRRKSPRLLSTPANDDKEQPKAKVTKKTKSKIKSSIKSLKDEKHAKKSSRKAKTSSGKKSTKTTAKTTKKSTSASHRLKNQYLPRTRQLEIEQQGNSKNKKVVFGVDEAGRGPLAGPVVAAAVMLPTNISGIIDSKQITLESQREDLYTKIITSTGIHYAISVVDAVRIDEINILQATMQAMHMVASALTGRNLDNYKVRTTPSVDHEGCYIVTNMKRANNNQTYYALIDGNKVPKYMPCDAESIVKGDSKEYCIAAASILAKVTRDRLMHGYDKLYPKYNLGQHKGYPTQAHRDAVLEYGASKIHRRTFAPLKSMEFDENGNVIRSDIVANNKKSK